MTTLPLILSKTLLTLLGGYVVFEDYRSREVLLWPVMIFVIGLFPFLHHEGYGLGIIIVTLLLIPLYFQWIAAVDMMLISISPLVLRVDQLPAIFIATGIGLILYKLITKEERLPFLTVYIPILWGLLFFG